jgi:hypothetical protein
MVIVQFIQKGDYSQVIGTDFLFEVVGSFGINALMGKRILPE